MILTNIQLGILIAFSLADTIITYLWVNKVLTWKPGTPYNKLEANPFIRFCWKSFTIPHGSMLSGTVLLMLQIWLANLHIIMYYIIMAILLFAVGNHTSNFRQLNNIIKAEKDKLVV